MISPASAQTKTKNTPSASANAEDTDQGYAYKFGDDLLSGGVFGANVAQIKVRSHGMRRTLIRPRLHFVPELLKSVEDI